ncbi:MAG: hypothetical protein IKV62_04120 [Bacteroidales bacterium]|nr:hypothetical protein [Bacteroidales bacterium]
MVDMRKTILILSSLALLASGCNKVETEEKSRQEETPGHLTVDIKVGYEGETRSVKTGWETGDKIYVVFDSYFTDDLTVGTSETAYYLTLTYNGSSWNSSFSDRALEEYLLDPEHASGQLAAAYSTAWQATDFKYESGSIGNVKIARLIPTSKSATPGMFLYAQNVDYSVTDGKLTATLNMSIDNTVVHFFIPGISSTDSGRYSLKCDFLGYIACSYFMTSHWPSDENYRAPAVNHPDYFDRTIPATACQDGAYFCASLHSSARGKSIQYYFQIIDNNGTEIETDDYVRSMTVTTTLNGRDAIALPSLDDERWNTVGKHGFTNDHEWVEVNGVKWATMNVGADAFDDALNAVGFLLNWEDVYDLVLSENSFNYWGKDWRLPTTEEWNSLISSELGKKCVFRKYYENSDNFRRWEIVAPDGLTKLYFPRGIGYQDENGDFKNTSRSYYWTKSYDVFSFDDNNASNPASPLSQDKSGEVNRRCKLAIRLVATE